MQSEKLQHRQKLSWKVISSYYKNISKMIRRLLNNSYVAEENSLKGILNFTLTFYDKITTPLYAAMHDFSNGVVAKNIDNLSNIEKEIKAMRPLFYPAEDSILQVEDFDQAQNRLLRFKLKVSVSPVFYDLKTSSAAATNNGLENRLDSYAPEFEPIDSKPNIDLVSGDSRYVQPAMIKPMVFDLARDSICFKPHLVKSTKAEDKRQSGIGSLLGLW